MPGLFYKAYLCVYAAAVVVRSTLSYFAHGPSCPQWSYVQHMFREIVYYCFNYGKLNLLDELDAEEIDLHRYAKVANFPAIPVLPVPKSLATYRECKLSVSEIEIDPSLFRSAEIARRGLEELVEQDMAEPGKQRSLTYEVIVPESVREPLQHHCQDDSALYSCEPLFAGERVLLYFHGGGFAIGSAACMRQLVSSIAYESNVRAVSFNYRLAPLHPFPSQLHDAYIAYRYMLKQGFGPENVVLAGESAGATLCLILAFLLRSTGEPLPGGLALLSPWADLLTSMPSITGNAKHDIVTHTDIESPYHMARIYYAPKRRLDEQLVEELRHHFISPINGDFLGFPPTLIQTGDKEVFHDEDVELHKRIVAANPDRADEMVLESYPDMIHVFQAQFFLRESKNALASIGRFVGKLQETSR